MLSCLCQAFFKVLVDFCFSLDLVKFHCLKVRTFTLQSDITISSLLTSVEVLFTVINQETGHSPVLLAYHFH